ncbi:MAG: hypothetical protein NVSMB65_14550 [Chloroflexota bacterium]
MLVADASLRYSLRETEAGIARLTQQYRAIRHSDIPADERAADTLIQQIGEMAVERDELLRALAA